KVASPVAARPRPTSHLLPKTLPAHRAGQRLSENQPASGSLALRGSDHSTGSKDIEALLCERMAARSAELKKQRKTLRKKNDLAERPV
ncbi:MAG: hypothetical protein AAFO17_16455, partial [Pseudomonadota bacterium]